MKGIEVKFGYQGHLVKATGVKCDPATPSFSDSMTVTAVTASPFQSFRAPAGQSDGRAALHAAA